MAIIKLGEIVEEGEMFYPGGCRGCRVKGWEDTRELYLGLVGREKMALDKLAALAPQVILLPISNFSPCLVILEIQLEHGVPPTKRLFKVAMLDPSPNLLVHGERLEIRDNLGCAIWKNLGYSEWSTPAGLKLARENLQSRVKEEDSITDVENAIFDLGVMDSLCFLLVNQRIFISMITKFIKFVELNFSVITRGFDIKVCMLKGPGSSFSSVGKQLAKSCEAKSLDSLGFKDATRSSVSWWMSGYEGLAFIEATSASTFAFPCSSSSF
ncbi:hypothetical protein Tco_0807136 [Tanacetum coccineum]